VLRIFGHSFRFIRHGAVKEEGRWADCFYGQQVVRLIKGDYPQSAILTSVLHELIESANHFMDIGLKHAQIEALEVGLFSMLTDNGVDLSVLLHRLDDLDPDSSPATQHIEEGG